jgi:hypothetical protein
MAGDASGLRSICPTHSAGSMDEQCLYFWCYLLLGLAGLRLFVDSAIKRIG